MILIGRKHPLIQGLADNIKFEEVLEVSTTNNGKKGKYFTNELIDGKKYFFHSEIPLFNPNRDIEYHFNIEDQMTMYRFYNNGNQNKSVLKNCFENDYLQYILESNKCKKIVCHVEKMAKALPVLLNSDIIKNKTIFKRIGINKKNIDFNKKDKKFRILFTNSYHDWCNSFYLRGGHLLLTCFSILEQKYPNLELVIRSSLPEEIKKNINSPNIKVYENRLSDVELHSLYEQSNLVVLLAARIHTHSLCQAFSYGIPAITSNGWAFDEYIENQVNGFIVEGFNDISYHDNEIGINENYQNIGNMQKEVYQYIIEQTCYYIEHLINNEDYYMTLRKNTKNISDTLYSTENWNDWVN
jgi:glycosyltransferase involved in cell wall biosynthesis